MKLESEIQQDQRPQRRKSHGIPYDFGLDDLTRDLGQYIKNSHTACHNIIGRQQLEYGPGNQYSSRTKKRKEIQYRHQYAKQKCIFDPHHQKSHDQDNSYHKHNAKLRQKISADQSFHISLQVTTVFLYTLRKIFLPEFHDLILFRNKKIRGKDGNDHIDQCIRNPLCNIAGHFDGRRCNLLHDQACCMADAAGKLLPVCLHLLRQSGKQICKTKRNPLQILRYCPVQYRKILHKSDCLDHQSGYQKIAKSDDQSQHGHHNKD